jgi:N-acetylmuramoyl-L-alanine amidase
MEAEPQMKVCIDAGHGVNKGMHTGARGCGLVEDTVALDIAQKLRWYLIQAGAQVVMTRSAPPMALLKDRGKIAKGAKCDMFVSIHCNAAAKAQAHGAEVLVTEGDTRSAALAEELLRVLVRHGLARRGVKWDSQSQHSKLRVLRDTYRAMPAVLLEVGFLTNTGDAKLLSSSAWRNKLTADMAKVMTT